MIELPLNTLQFFSSTSNTLRLVAEDDRGEKKNIIKLLVLLLRHVIDFWSLYFVISVVLSKLDFFRSLSFWRGWYSCNLIHGPLKKNPVSFIWKKPFDFGCMKMWSKNFVHWSVHKFSLLAKYQLSFSRFQFFSVKSLATVFIKIKS